MAFTEFYVQTTASNLNAGSTNSDSPVFSFTSGNWVQSTRVFTATGADLSGVTVGMFASVYPDGSTVAVFVGRITAVDDTLDLITIDATAISGTAPTDGTGDRSIRVGGAWAGPSGAEHFPIGVIGGTLTDASGNNVRVNFKNGVDYLISAVMTADIAGPINWEGYTTNPGDGGRAEFDGGEPAASFLLMTVTAANQTFTNLVFKRNGSTGSGANHGVTVPSGGNEIIFQGCVFHTVRGRGLDLTGGDNCIAAYCEVYGCNVVNAADVALRMNDLTAVIIGCVVHHNVGSLTNGIGVTLGQAIIKCIAYANGLSGIVAGQSAGTCLISQCDSYDNGGSGIDLSDAAATMIFIENCNCFGNTLFGIAAGTAKNRNGFIRNCAFGAGSKANGSGDIDSDLSSVYILNKVTYPADQTPWRNPDAGDFTVVNSLSRNTGFGTFTQTQAGQGGTQSFPNIGASQHAPEVFSSIN